MQHWAGHMAPSWFPEQPEVREEQQLPPGTASFPPHHCSAQPQSPCSVSPITFIYRSVRFLPHLPCQPPKTASPCLLQCVMSLHCPPSSGSIHWSELLQHQHPVPSDDSSMQPSYHHFQPHGNWRDILLPWEQLPAALAIPPTVLNLHTLPHLWIIPSSQSQPVHLTIHSSLPHHTAITEKIVPEESIFQHLTIHFALCFEIKNDSCKDIASLTPKKQFLNISITRTLNNP